MPTSVLLQQPEAKVEEKAEANSAEHSVTAMDQNGSDVSDGMKFTQAVMEAVLDFGGSRADLQKDGNAIISQNEQNPQSSSEPALKNVADKVDAVETKDIIDFDTPFSGDGSGDLGMFNSENWSNSRLL